MTKEELQNEYLYKRFSKVQGKIDELGQVYLVEESNFFDYDIVRIAKDYCLLYSPPYLYTAILNMERTLELCYQLSLMKDKSWELNQKISICLFQLQLLCDQCMPFLKDCYTAKDFLARKEEFLGRCLHKKF